MYPSSFTYTYTQINIRLFHYYLLKRLLFSTPSLCTFMKNHFPYKYGLVLFFFFQNCFVYSMSFYFHMNFVINLSTLQKYQKKKICWNFDWDFSVIDFQFNSTVKRTWFAWTKLFKFIKICFVTQIQCILVNILHALGNSVHSAVVWWSLW